MAALRTPWAAMPNSATSLEYPLMEAIVRSMERLQALAWLQARMRRKLHGRDHHTWRGCHSQHLHALLSRGPARFAATIDLDAGIIADRVTPEPQCFAVAHRNKAGTKVAALISRFTLNGGMPDGAVRLVCSFRTLAMSVCYVRHGHALPLRSQIDLQSAALLLLTALFRCLHIIRTQTTRSCLDPR